MQLLQSRRRGLTNVILLIISALVVVASVAFMGIGTPAEAQFDTLAPGPAVTNEQCANGDAGEVPDCIGSGSTGWITGNVGTSKNNYKLGDFIPYRSLFSGLAVGSEYCFGMNWDVAKAELPALDYIGSFDATLSTADPTDDTIFSLSDTKSTVAIPADPVLTGILDGSPFTNTQEAGVLTMWGGTLSSLTAGITP